VFSFHQVILNLAADAARVVVGVGSVMLLVVLLTRLWWRRRLACAAEPPPNVCRCGYPLGQLAVPRCPECGRVVGFEATAEDLGLSDEQLRRVQAARDKRRSAV
jgi:hypothetical protein